jgi:hypothetical protein
MGGDIQNCVVHTNSKSRRMSFGRSSKDKRKSSKYVPPSSISGNTTG